MRLDRLPVALGALLCAALAFFWLHAPVLRDSGSTAGFAAEFARTVARQRLIVFPLGVATSIATLVVRDTVTAVVDLGNGTVEEDTATCGPGVRGTRITAICK